MSSFQVAEPSKRTEISKRAALSVAALAVAGGALFAPSVGHAAAPPASDQKVEAGCGDCYPDVI
ncbi:hypothetical protein PUR28_29705 [Streptomyces sp. BE308]|uniref:hypothetical protein n=1 Tax=unclassified Streptomyces TaxID=2593676 RepID=UPI002DD8FE39|nr:MULTISPECIES: hypothetical protein [unclassified Streptomyces]MEE1794902.1 hypothetical protein [Streptomyces sp. BE308]WRZ70863.1 hypothetical protein OG251_04175 [Streptomyces sp. NBC_01237]